jgi:hypothetical protein
MRLLGRVLLRAPSLLLEQQVLPWGQGSRAEHSPLQREEALRSPPVLLQPIARAGSQD